MIAIFNETGQSYINAGPTTGRHMEPAVSFLSITYQNDRVRVGFSFEHENVTHHHYYTSYPHSASSITLSWLQRGCAGIECVPLVAARF